MTTIDLSSLYAGAAQLADLEGYIKAVVSRVAPGADVTLTGQAPVWMYLCIAHALHGKVRRLCYESPVTGPVTVFDHNPRKETVP